MAAQVALLGAALREGQQQCYLPPTIGSSDLKSILAMLGKLHLCFPGPQVPATPRAPATQAAGAQNAVPATIPATVPGTPGTMGRLGGYGGLEFWYCWSCSWRWRPSQLLFSCGSNPVGRKAAGGPRSFRSSTSSSTTSNTHKASSTLQMRSPLPLCLSQRHISPHIGLTFCKRWEMGARDGPHAQERIWNSHVFSTAVNGIVNWLWSVAGTTKIRQWESDIL